MNGKGEATCFEVIPVEGVLAIRLILINRQGSRFSYPYAYMGLVSCPHPQFLRIDCHCGAVEAIQIEGSGLDHLAMFLDFQRLALVREADHAAYMRERTVVELIQIRLRA